MSEDIKIPYELPEGWKWCRLGDVADWGSGGTPSRKNPEYYKGTIPWIKTGELNESYIYDSEEKISEDAIKNSSAKLFPKETVALAMYGATIGKTAIFGIEASTNQACACAICHKDLDNHYLFQFLKSKKDYFISSGKGGAQPNISQEIIKNTIIPLPPTLEEQQRIVNRIETLFAILDLAKEKAQNVVDTFETRKASILHKAFTGELTKKWRAENGVGEDSWVEKTIGEIVSGFKYGISDKCDYDNKGISVLRIPNIDYGFIDYSDLKFAEKESVEENYYVKKNDILIIRSNGSRDLVGKSALSENNDEKYTYGSFLIKITPSEIVNPKYLVVFLNSKDARNQMFNKAKSSSGIHNINSKELSIIGIKICSLPEQQEIVRILDVILEKETKAKEAAEAVLEQIDLLKKSILARAFRGEL